jgi:GNAT superfamily N-acetyltransferase
MEISAVAVRVDEILPLRDLFRQEMGCQIVHDSLHFREGWTQTYLLKVAGAVAGYGSIVLGGPWTGKRTAFEFYVVPEQRSRVFDLFSSLLTASGATTVEAQTNDVLLTVMLHTWGRDIKSESIVFQDKLTTAHSPAGVTLRRIQGDDPAGTVKHQQEPEEWILEIDGAMAATGGILFHYNRPYGDIYMKVEEPFRRRGLGCYLVQELKKVCYGLGSIPCARCNPTNVASRKTLQKAGFVPCAHILNGTISLK